MTYTVRTKEGLKTFNTLEKAYQYYWMYNGYEIGINRDC